VPRRQPLTSPAVRAALIAAIVLLAGCGKDPEPAPVTPPTPDATAAAACAALHAELPGTVDGGERIETEPESGLTAAWQVSDDARIVVRCGVGRPPVGPTTLLREINDVEWFSPDVAPTDEYVYTTFGRVANLELTIPPGRVPAGALVDLADVVKKTLPPST
jgi:hypothetical protein